MRACRRLALLTWLVTCGTPLGAAAQTVATYCETRVPDETPTNLDVLHPQVVYRSVSAAIERNDWGQVATTLADELRATKAAIPAPMRASFQRQLDAFAREMRDVVDSEDAAEKMANAASVRQARFKMDRSDAGGYAFFKGTPDEIEITPTTGLAVAREICYRAYGAAKILAKYGEPGRNRVRDALTHYVSLWDNYNRNGYSQYPWELYVNGLWTLQRDSYMPPRTQWVLMHPAVAIELPWPHSSDWRRLDVISVEPVGYLRYRNDRTTYVGASLLVSISAAADAGFGGLAHLGRVGKLGYVYHRRSSTAGARHGVVFSLDLYRIVAGVPQKLEDARARVAALKDSLR